MNVKSLTKVSLNLSGLILLGSVLFYYLGKPGIATPLIILFFVLFLIGMNSIELLKGFSFTIWVIAAATISMIYPEYITSIGGYQTDNLIVPLIQLIMFGMGTTMGIKDFAGVLKMPKGVLVGLVLQFTIMPLVALSLTQVFNFPPEIAAGVILIGCVPCGVSSNILNFLSKGNLALSITLTSFATLMAPLVTPLLMERLAGQFIPIDVSTMILSISKMIFLPLIAGIVYNRFLGSRSAWLNASMPVIAMAANVFIIAVIVAAGRDSLLSMGFFLFLAAFIHNAMGFLLGYWGGRLFKLNKRDSRTIAIEVGLQNGGMAAGIAQELGRAATMGLYPAIFGTWMDISGSFLANLWRKKPVEDNVLDEETESDFSSKKVIVAKPE
ncbi:bile acid:sodium symporter family protein [Daejeonella sp. JGW-45]|uniref:bile acid:sodium symporter family protein n=1 Tax=Daejeonella sp. JGW-45 TaxID=3034148 RepID=UPI0023EDF035|nr:bile acid:sodium symporter family protein [Daejeonella sp. JGW-45]